MKNVVLPPMTWVIDKALADKDGHIPNNMNLSDLAGPEKEINANKATIELVNKEFNSHKPVFIPPPIADSDQWVNLSSYPFDEMKEEYKNEMERVRQLLMNATKKQKTTYSNPMTCVEYAEFLKTVVLTANRQDLELMDYLLSIVNESVAVGIRNYTNSMSQVTLPVDEVDLKENHREAESNAFKAFDENIEKDFSKNIIVLRNKGKVILSKSIEELYKNILKDNEDASDKYNARILEIFRKWYDSMCMPLPNCAEQALEKAGHEVRNLKGPKTLEYHRKIYDVVQPHTPPQLPDYTQYLAMALVACVALIATHYRFGERVRGVVVLDYLMPVLYWMAWILTIVIAAALCLGRQKDLATILFLNPSLILHGSVAAVLFLIMVVSLVMHILAYFRVIVFMP